MKETTAQVRQPITKGAHFGLSLLAVLLGIPLSLGFLFILGICIVLIIGIVISASVGSSGGITGKVPREYTYSFGNPSSINRIISVPVYGPILSQSSASDPLQTIFGSGYTDGEATKEHLRDLADDPTVKAVILEIDSPGGLVTASKAIADGAEYVRARNKPIIAHINGYGASGGYWVAASTDSILAEQGSETGSIGVILGDIPYFKNITTLGEITTADPITLRSFSAGTGKDIGNPFRDMSAEEVTFLQESLNNEYGLFVAYIAGRRGITEDVIRNTIKAYPYDTLRAQQLRLIDKVASKEEAYIDTAKQAGIERDFIVEKEQTATGFLGSLFSAMRRTPPKDVRAEARARYCAGLQAKPLLLHGTLASICPKS